MINNKQLYNYRHLARVIVEAKTPLAVGTGVKDLTTDACVARDINGLPYIPGTSLAGVLRHGLCDSSLDATVLDGLFGFQNGQQTQGSRLILSDALLVGPNGHIIDGLYTGDADLWQDDFYKHFKELPIRNHVRINHQGTGVNMGKYDGQVGYKGMRFCFELEMVDGNICEQQAPQTDLFDTVIDMLCSAHFRVGGGTRSGFGALEIVSIQKTTLDLADTQTNDLQKYIAKSSSLADTSFWKDYDIVSAPSQGSQSDDWTAYTVVLQPDDFFLFGSGKGDQEVDMTTVKELYIAWDKGVPTCVDSSALLIPGSSIKGALAHRVAYLWNKQNGHWGDKAKVGIENPAVCALFGPQGENKENERENTPAKRGNVLFSDLLLDHTSFDEKILNHVAIDRFTGGAKPGALFSEKVTVGRGQTLNIEIQVNHSRVETEEEGRNAIVVFEESLKHLCCGLLPLGGGVQRGHGAMTGKLYKNNTLIYEDN